MSKKLDPHQAETVAYHEAGHAVAAFLQGVATRNVTITPDEDYPSRHTLRWQWPGVHLGWEGKSCFAQPRG